MIPLAVHELGGRRRRIELWDRLRPRRLVLLQVDQQLAEGPRLRVPPELADPLDAVQIGKAEDVEEFAASPDGRASRRLRSRPEETPPSSSVIALEVEHGTRPRGTSSDPPHSHIGYPEIGARDADIRAVGPMWAPSRWRMLGRALFLQSSRNDVQWVAHRRLRGRTGGG
jgi:hypothetical protein